MDKKKGKLRVRKNGRGRDVSLTESKFSKNLLNKNRAILTSPKEEQLQP